MRQCRKELLAAATLALTVSGCVATAPAAIDTRDPYAVYAAVLRETVLAEGFGGPPRDEAARGPIEQLVIVERTDSVWWQSSAESIRSGFPSLDTTTVADFLANAGGTRLERKLEGIGPYVFFTEADRVSIFEEFNSWRPFYERFPGAPGLVAFSPVGFNVAGTEAIVYMMHGRGGTWAHGTLYALRMEGGEWRIVAQQGLWEA